MRWSSTNNGTPRRRCLPLSAPTPSAATLCMLALASVVAVAVADPLRPRADRSVEYSAKYDDFEASQEEEQPYSFQYEVDAPYHGTWHDRHEVKSGQGTEGRFRVALPDHRLQTVTYRASNAKGFTADVQFEQHPDFNALRGGIGKAPVIGTPVVPSAPHPSSGSKAQPQRPEYGYQIAVGNDYGKRQRRPPKEPAQSHENPSSHSSSKFASRPLSSSEGYKASSHESGKFSSRPISSSEGPKSFSHESGKFSSRPLSSSEGSKSFSHESGKFSSRPLSSSVGSKATRPSASRRPHRKHTSRPSSVVYELPEGSSLSHHSPGSLSAFVSVSPHLIQHTTPLPVPRRTSTPSSVYPPSLPTGDKKVVPSRPLRTRQRTTTRRPHRKPQDLPSSYDSRPPSYGDKQLSRPRPPVTSEEELPHSDLPQEDSIPQGESVDHLPDKAEPHKKGMEPPATTDESFSIASKPERYSIRKEGMSSIRSRLNSIVHD